MAETSHLVSILELADSFYCNFELNGDSNVIKKVSEGVQTLVTLKLNVSYNAIGYFY